MFVATGSPIQQSVTAWIHAAHNHSGDRSSTPSPPPCGQSDRLLGDRHILVFFSHLSGGQYLIGDYDTERDKFLVDAHGLFTFGPVFPGGVHAPTAFPDGEGGVIVMFNMNPARPTPRMDNYLSGFFGGGEGWLEEAQRG